VKNVVVLGSGFAGLWAAVGAARRLDELRIPARDVVVTVISSQPFHDIRVRNYEPDLTACRIPLSAVLDPVGVAHITAEVTAIDVAARIITFSGSDGFGSQEYDRLVFALGSSVVRPDLPGLREFGFDIDTYDQAIRLNRHLASLADGPRTPGAATVVVVGAGLTGIEAACELPGRLAGLLAGRDGCIPRVLLIDHNPLVGSDMGDSARPLIEAALADNGVEALTGVGVTAVDADSVTLSTGQRLAASTVVWCAGMRANPLTALFGIELDRLGRVPVDDYLQVVGVPSVFAAGDVAAAKMDDQHLSVMSCQHGRPMGRYAGYNVISDLLGEPMLALRIPWYVTILDLGPAGAVYTEGWDRQVVAHGAQAKATKRVINTERIYPPVDGDRAKILAAAAPELQARPVRG
jgi:NADH dehydrogenase